MILVDEHINSFNSPFKFNGKEYDEETGNYYYSARYYDPKFSIFIGVDPLADKYPGISPFAYCLNNPVKLTDLDGMAPTPPNLSRITIVENVMSGKKWINYNNNIVTTTTLFGMEVDRTSRHGECADYSRLQVEQGSNGNYTAEGSKRRIDMYTESRQTDKSKFDLQRGIDTIIENLTEGKAVMAGVKYKDGSTGDNPNKSTNHFVTIVGMGRDEDGRSYFSYYDNFTGGKGEKVGTDTVLNRFTLHVDSKGNYYFADADNNIPYNGNKEAKLGNKENRPARYILTEVRDND